MVGRAHQRPPARPTLPSGKELRADFIRRQLETLEAKVIPRRVGYTVEGPGLWDAWRPTAGQAEACALVRLRRHRRRLERELRSVLGTEVVRE
ncbi:hypothetical protein [Rathayibacter sp. PhB151]|uniref:hypothetical protein n=1 Tax=Rathayibacter sp. PhB151 TaxID=2485189 RepID=UPI001062EDEC|nr:hypothetical protein [Rathayibacter sp. PhB151]